MEDIFSRLNKSKFRSKFHLKNKHIDYINKVGLEKIKSHAYDFVTNRLKVKQPNDGKQTPYDGHPVFVAQHACAICCRSCIYKWHKINPEKVLTEKEIDYLVSIIMKWIENELKR